MTKCHSDTFSSESEMLRPITNTMYDADAEGIPFNFMAVKRVGSNSRAIMLNSSNASGWAVLNVPQPIIFNFHIYHVVYYKIKGMMQTPQPRRPTDLSGFW